MTQKLMRLANCLIAQPGTGTRETMTYARPIGQVRGHGADPVRLRPFLLGDSMLGCYDHRRLDVVIAIVSTLNMSGRLQWIHKEPCMNLYGNS